MYVNLLKLCRCSVLWCIYGACLAVIFISWCVIVVQLVCNYVLLTLFISLQAK